MLDVFRLLPFEFEARPIIQAQDRRYVVTRNPGLIRESPKEETEARKRRSRRWHDLWGFEDRKAVGDLAGSKNSGDLFA